MTEAGWRTGSDPVEMLIHLHFAALQPRKLALFAFAGCRLLWEYLDVSARKRVEAAERDEASGKGVAEVGGGFLRDLVRQEVGMVSLQALQQHERSHSRASDLVRDIFGNPFRPVAVDPAWLTSTVVALAEGIDAERAFDRLPILADALQDAGCENADVLDHCRGDGPHVRGCWVVDLVLGKS